MYLLLEKIKLRLKSLGYEPTENDDFALEFVMDKTEQRIKHFCNISEIPDCLEWVFIEMACGDFLQAKKSLGQLTNMQVEQIVKKIEDGDTTVELSSKFDPDTVFNEYTEKLINSHNESLLKHRKLVW